MREQGLEERRKKLTRKNIAAPASLLKPAPVPFLVLLSPTFPFQLYLRTTRARFLLALLAASDSFESSTAVDFTEPSAAAEISFTTEGKDKAKVVVEMIQRWYLGGASAESQTTVRSLADHFTALLSSSP